MNLEEIAARLRAIAEELEADNADVEALEREADELMAQRSTLLANAQKRTNLRQKLSNGGGIVVGGKLPDTKTESQSRTLAEVLTSPEYESAWAKRMMMRPDSAFTELEKRALGEATTTTATEAVTPTTGVDGVNNGGLIIPTNVVDTFLKNIELESPIFRDINKVNVIGYITLPYKKRQVGAKAQKEGIANHSAEFAWGEIKLVYAEISVTCRITWKLENMAPKAFIDYLIGELNTDLNSQIVEQLVYGTGENDDTCGITFAEGIINKPYDPAATKDLDALADGLSSLDPKEKPGAKIYAAADIAEHIAFAKDENGTYMFNPVNGTGIQNVATVKVEIDPYLHPGDYIIGNLKRNVLLNLEDGVKITKDISGRNRANDYTSYVLMGVGTKPNAIVYGYAEEASSE